MGTLCGAWLRALAVVSLVVSLGSSALAQVPVASAATPSLHGGTPVTGSVVLGEIGYAAVRASLYLGLASDVDVGVELAAPTFGHNALPGWNQDVGLDARVPFRIRLARWARGSGALKAAPLFHVGRGCYWSYRGSCGARALGTGVVLGFVADVALPKVFKVIAGIEQQLGLHHFKDTDSDARSNRFAAATWLDLGLEALWREKLFFTLIMNVGAQYGSDRFHDGDHALFRQLFGVGYRFR